MASSSNSSDGYRVWPAGSAAIQQGELNREPFQPSIASLNNAPDPFQPSAANANSNAYPALGSLGSLGPQAAYNPTYYEGTQPAPPSVHTSAADPFSTGVDIRPDTGIPPRRVLIILSGEDHVDLVSGKHKETGFFLSELAIPYFSLKSQGYQVVFANPNGAVPHMDPFSNSTLWFGIGGGDQMDRAKAMLREEPSFMRPVVLSSLDENALSQFRGVFIPGGHAPMQDLIRHPEVGRVIAHFHKFNKPTGAICHGPAALLPARKPDNSWMYSGYSMCCYSNSEEWLTELMWWDKLPLKLETALSESGGCMNQAFPMASRVVEDRELVTGQNPRSADQFASVFIAKLNRYPEEMQELQLMQQQRREIRPAVRPLAMHV